MLLEKEKVFQTIYDSMDAIFVADTAADKYEIIRDNGKFTEIFGMEGSYKDMMIKFMEGTIDKRVSQGGVYSVFFDKASGFVGRISKKAKMHYKGEDFYFQFNNLPVDETRNIILITYIDEDAYFTESRGDVKTQAMKSAYLFSMFVDLVEDKCSNMDMSEIESDPVNSLRITYSEWREQIVKMIDEKQQKEFLRFTDPEYLKENVLPHQTKSREFFMMNLEGQFKWVNLIFSRIDTGYENDQKMVFVVEDNSEAHDRTTKGLENELEKYQKLSKHDSLTGLLNHGNIEKVLADCLSAKPLSLIMLDIDHFKKVNDTFGHAAGDAVLKKFASIAKENLKACNCDLGRWGGEEFLGICKETAGDKMAEIAEKLRKIIEDTEFETVGHITSSFGVIEVLDGEGAKEAFERLDAALYKAKETGRNRVVRG